MSARPAPQAQLRPMSVADVDTVAAIEASAYSFPWSRGNFVDSLAAGYRAMVWEADGDGIVGYCIAMPGVGEMHLLNITVAPAWQGCGLSHVMLDWLEDDCRDALLAMLWLEVRESNVRARTLYRRRGFIEVGRRRGYYPAPRSMREDAVVMSLKLFGEDGRALD